MNFTSTTFKRNHFQRRRSDLYILQWYAFYFFYPMRMTYGSRTHNKHNFWKKSFPTESVNPFQTIFNGDSKAYTFFNDWIVYLICVLLVTRRDRGNYNLKLLTLLWYWNLDLNILVYLILLRTLTLNTLTWLDFSLKLWLHNFNMDTETLIWTHVLIWIKTSTFKTLLCLLLCYSSFETLTLIQHTLFKTPLFKHVFF